MADIVTPRTAIDNANKEDLSEVYKHRKQRNELLAELLATENTYLGSLKELVNAYLQPTREKELMPPDDIGNIFSGVEILVQVHEQFYASLLEAQKDENIVANRGGLGSVFRQFVPFLRMYAMYVNNYDVAYQTLEKYKNKKKYAAFLDEQRSSGAAKLDIASLLIQPIQRIPRYEMLLAGLLKHSQKTSEEYPAIENALDEIKTLAKYINESKRNSERRLVLLAIQNKVTGSLVRIVDPIVQPHRYLIREGPLQKHAKNPLFGPKLQKRYAYLFNDVFMFVTEDFNFKGAINLAAAACEDIAGTEDSTSSFRIIRESATQTFTAPGFQEKIDWLLDITEAINKLQGNIANQEDEFTEDGRERANLSAASCEDGGASSEGRKGWLGKLNPLTRGQSGVDLINSETCVIQHSCTEAPYVGQGDVDKVRSPHRDSTMEPPPPPVRVKSTPHGPSDDATPPIPQQRMRSSSAQDQPPPPPQRKPPQPTAVTAPTAIPPPSGDGSGDTPPPPPVRKAANTAATSADDEAPPKPPNRNVPKLDVSPKPPPQSTPSTTSSTPTVGGLSPPPLEALTHPDFQRMERLLTKGVITEPDFKKWQSKVVAEAKAEGGANVAGESLDTARDDPNDHELAKLRKFHSKGFISDTEMQEWIQTNRPHLAK